MAKRWLRRCCSAVLLGVLATSGCTPNQQAAAEAAVANPEVQELLGHVPADTPYVFVGLSGSSRAFADKLGSRAEPLLQQAEAGLSTLLAEVGGQDSDGARVMRAVGAELKGKLSIAGLETLGFDFDARYVIYGLGLLPATRVRMKDTAALKAMLARVQASSGVTFPVASHKGQDYWHGGDDKFEFVAAITDRDVVLGVVAAGPTREQMLSMLFGQDRPASALADVSVLKDVIAAHGLGQYSAGFVDIRGLTDALVGAGTGFNQETAAILRKGATVSPECAGEIRGLAGIMPRIAFGTTRLDEVGLETRVVAELRTDLALGLAAVRTSVPGLDGATHKDVMFGMGSGVDVGQAVELAKAQARVVEAAPFKCPDLAWINEAARAVVRGAPEVPAEVRQLRGFAFALEDASFMGFLPTNVKGYATVGATDPAGMLRALKAIAPDELAMIPELAEDGVPQRLSLGGVVPLPLPFEMFVAGRRDVGLALAVGGGAEQRAGTLLTERGEATPLMVFHFNVGRFMKLIPTGTDMPSSAIASIIGSQGYVIDAGPQGLVARSWVNFAE